PERNVRLLDELASVVALGYPVAVGRSRKRFLGHATGRPVEDRDRATTVACALAWERGARVFRVHDAAVAREALLVACATMSSRCTSKHTASSSRASGRTSSRSSWSRS